MFRKRKPGRDICAAWNVRYALPYLNRAYFFDNSTQQSLYLAEYESEVGFTLHSELLPSWFRRFVLGE